LYNSGIDGKEGQAEKWERMKEKIMNVIFNVTDYEKFKIYFYQLSFAGFMKYLPTAELRK
jgi:hypothetical protein